MCARKEIDLLGSFVILCWLARRLARGASRRRPGDGASGRARAELLDQLGLGHDGAGRLATRLDGLDAGCDYDPTLGRYLQPDPIGLTGVISTTTLMSVATRLTESSLMAC